MRLDPVRLSNPMSVEQSVMRTMLLPGLLGAVRDNIDRQNDPPNLFEHRQASSCGTSAVPAPEHAAESGAMLPHEPEAVGIVLCGPLQAENWTGIGRPTDFYTLKGVVDAMLAAVRLRGDYAPLGDAAAHFPYLHPGASALVSVAGAGGAGVLGAAAARRRRRVRDRGPRRVLRVAGRPLRTGRTWDDRVRRPRHVPAGDPGPRRRWCALDVPSAAVVERAGRAGGKLVQSVRVFDVYEGDQVPAGKRSLALRLVMRSPERTLTEKDITEVRRRVLQALERELGATLR